MKVSIKIFTGLSLLLLLLAGCKSTNKSSELATIPNSGLNFVKSDGLSKVLEKASRTDQIVFMDIYTDWCAPCKLMDEYVFSDVDTQKFMNENFINYKVNAEKGNGQTIATIYGANIYPTLVFVDKDGKVLARREGATTITELKNLAQEAILAKGP
jgi:Thiol:disulfide interchange protein